MANARGREIDNTHLSIDQAEDRGFLHRDYIAHCLRWTHVANFVGKSGRYKDARVLDIGCGIDLPLAKMLYSSRYIVEEYVGVDYNTPGKFKLEPFHSGKMPTHAYGDVIFPQHLEIHPDGGTYSISGMDEWHKLPNVITMFEVFEHIEPGHGRLMLKGIYNLLSLDSNANAFISTPCYDANVGAADNHVSEVTYQALGALLEDLGFAIVGHWGTFASQRDYKERLFADYPDMKGLWKKLTNYYDSNYIATLFAPLYPQHSRNCLWQLAAASPDYQRQFPELKDVAGPWTSSERWSELNG
jgi:hypothetical protein